MGEVIQLRTQRILRLPPRQRKCLEFITGWRARYGGNWPSFETIAEGAGLRSKLGAVRTVNALFRAGLLQRPEGKQ